LARCSSRLAVYLHIFLFFVPASFAPAFLLSHNGRPHAIPSWRICNRNRNKVEIEPLAKFSRGELIWEEAMQEIASRCDERFAARLRWAAWLQRALFKPLARSVLMFLAARSEWLWREIFQRTR
jgi:hypothetical protein